MPGRSASSQPGINRIVYPSGEHRTSAELARLNNAEVYSPDTELVPLIEND